MSLEKIQLPDFLIADLYKDCLVELENLHKEAVSTPAQQKSSLPKKEASEENKIQFTGNNLKNVAVIVQPDKEALSESDHTFLINILKACNLTVADIAIINIKSQQVDFQLLQQQLKTSSILLFNVVPSSINLPFSIPEFQVQPYDNCVILTAPALSVLNKQTNESRVLKTKLWASLKRIFNI